MSVRPVDIAERLGLARQTINGFIRSGMPTTSIEEAEVADDRTSNIDAVDVDADSGVRIRVRAVLGLAANGEVDDGGRAGTAGGNNQGAPFGVSKFNQRCRKHIGFVGNDSRNIGPFTGDVLAEVFANCWSAKVFVHTLGRAVGNGDYAYACNYHCNNFGSCRRLGRVRRNLSERITCFIP